MSEDTTGEGPRPARLGNVLHPVSDIGAAVRFYGAALGIVPRFVDGERYAQLDAGGAALALAAPSEDITEGVVAASFKVADVGATLTALTAAGGTVLRPPVQGGHEVRALAKDPWGNTLIVYGPG